MSDAVSYRRATREELDVAVGWAADEGWNPGRHDADAFWATDPDGFVVAERDGVVIATGSIVAYGEALGFMGFFIVRPDLRGQGIGRAFWTWRRDLLRARLAPGAPIGMDGVLAMVPFYGAGGFELAHRNTRMTGTPRGGRVDEELASDADLARLVDFDRAHFGVERSEFLRRWIGADGSHLAVAGSDAGAIRGYGVLRPCRVGYKLGPLFAADPSTAERLARHLVAVADGRQVSLDVPGVNPDAIELARQLGLDEEFSCGRMYLGEAPDLPWSSIYGVTTFELG